MENKMEIDEQDTDSSHIHENGGIKHCEGDGGERKRFILRELTLKNFVKFKEEITLTFEGNGAHYLIGETQSGKSSIFEAIRRCLSTEINSSLSSRCTENDSIVVCKYISKDGHVCISFYIREAGNKNEFVKGCVILDKSSQVIDHGIDHYKYENDKIKLETSLSDCSWPETELRAFTTEAMKDKKDKKWLDKLAPVAKRYTSDNRCEGLLEMHQICVGFTFAMRGIGPLQWSKSKKIKKRNDNYREASDRAEIINWYLKNKDKLSDKVKEDEKKYFDYITNGKGGEYKLKKDEIFVNEKYPILKQSEGFLEAKICSILLAQDKFHTLCLEDPGTGMHVQMIERLRVLMSSKDIDKVVILSTHSPSFINPEFVHRMFFLRKDNDVNRITTGKELAKDKVMSAIPGTVSVHDFANLCFAEKTIFVEGPSDLQFLEAFATYMRQGKTIHRSIQFVSMGGKDKHRGFGKFCQKLQKEHYFILDESKDQRGNDPEQKTSYILGFKSLEGLFFDEGGVFRTFIDKHVSIEAVKDILQNCTTERLEIDEKKNVITNVRSLKKKFKIFLHGNETFDERIKFVEFLLGNINMLGKSKAAKSLTNLHEFLDAIYKGKELPVFETETETESLGYPFGCVVCVCVMLSIGVLVVVASCM